MAASWTANRVAYFTKPSGAAAPLLGRGTRKVYLWIRQSLGLKMRMGIDEDVEETDKHASRIYADIVNGDINSILIEALTGEGR